MERQNLFFIKVQGDPYSLLDLFMKVIIALRARIVDHHVDDSHNLMVAELNDSKINKCSDRSMGSET